MGVDGVVRAQEREPSRRGEIRIHKNLNSFLPKSQTPFRFHQEKMKGTSKNTSPSFLSPFFDYLLSSHETPRGFYITFCPFSR